MKNFHSQPFDEATLVKLDLFRNYIREWLPVFLVGKSPARKMTIVDFFAGPGRDISGQPGSPLIAIEEIRLFREHIQGSATRVHLELNEAVKSKATSLRELLEAERIERDLCSWNVGSRGFEEAFASLSPALYPGPNLLLLDQQGVKFISDEVFDQLIKLPKTDFIFFTASSIHRRFESHPSLRKHFSMREGTVTAKDFNDTHRAVVDYYRQLARASSPIFLGSFSIKKGSNIYGLIFGSAHPLGIEKFLRVCWKTDPERGEANFDIDDDRIDSAAPSLFPEMDVPKKLQIFERQLEARIASGELSTDGRVYIACLEAGFLPRHGREVLKAQIKKKKVRCIGQPRVSRDGYREPRELEVVND